MIVFSFPRLFRTSLMFEPGGNVAIWLAVQPNRKRKETLHRIADVKRKFGYPKGCLILTIYIWAFSFVEWCGCELLF